MGAIELLAASESLLSPPHSMATTLSLFVIASRRSPQLLAQLTPLRAHTVILGNLTTLTVPNEALWNRFTTMLYHTCLKKRNRY
jgi:hypothetical protein